MHHCYDCVYSSDNFCFSGQLENDYYDNVFSSPEPKAQVSFSDQNLSVVRRRCPSSLSSLLS